MIKRIIKKILAGGGLEVRKIEKIFNPIHLWDEDLEFNNIYKEARTNTVVDKVRCFMLYQFFKQTLNLNGDVAEIGVYRGGTAKLLARTLEGEKVNKNIQLFDTFEGMPEISEEKDLHKKGDFNTTSIERVSKYLSEHREIIFHKGFFPKTAAPVEDKKFSFVHIDVDIYQSVVDCCEFFYPRMVCGGVMMFDDYGFISCPGAKSAVDNFFKDKKESPCYLSSGQCLVVKL